MSVHEEILGFLDGTLSAEAEAELLHRMSVSPERRALLRGYFDQSNLIARDKQSITVPFDAEQGLWARIDRLMPSPAAIPTPTVAPVATGWTSFVSKSSAVLSSLLLLVGLGTGYFIGSTNTTSTPSTLPTAAVLSSIERPAPQPVAQAPVIKERIITKYIIKRVPVHYSEAALGTTAASVDDAVSLNAPDVTESPVDPSAISIAEPVTTMPELAVGDEKLKPVFARGSSEPEQQRKTILERFEFSFNESFGKQFPNSEATNTTLPLITNSSISAYFQVLPNSTALWAGASIGTANVTRKTLTTSKNNPHDLLEEEVRGEYVHVQTNWAGAFLQYRTPLFTRAELMLTGGMGFANAGTMSIGEIGVHYDATKDVGFTVGLRGTRLAYDLASEKQEIIRNSRGALSIPRGTTDATPSYNVELATGLFFHF